MLMIMVYAYSVADIIVLSSGSENMNECPLKGTIVEKKKSSGPPANLLKWYEDLDEFPA